MLSLLLFLAVYLTYIHLSHSYGKAKKSTFHKKKAFARVRKVGFLVGKASRWEVDGPLWVVKSQTGICFGRSNTTLLVNLIFSNDKNMNNQIMPKMLSSNK